jgi:ubiquinone/menaquinone biosynthesis C-methylase UbiE
LDSAEACRISCGLTDQVAHLFESRVVPLWQGVYDSLVARAEIEPKSRVLDLGTGTGEVALRAGKITGPKGSVLGSDMSREMIRIARDKARRLGLTNVSFRQMNMEALDLPDDSFDRVVGNYSVCCCFDYKATLSETLRVLKRKGKLTYSHNGPGESLEFQLMQRLLEKYRSKKPSGKLRAIRDANALQDRAWSQYRDPFATLNLMRTVGYKFPEATISQRSVKYRSARDFLDRLLKLSWKPEAEEMSEKTLGEFVSEALSLLAPFSNGSELVISDEMIFFTGYKRQ